MKVKYCGPCLDYSGYGEACRHDVAALVATGNQVVTEIPTYTLEISDFGKLGQLVVDLQGRQLGYKYKILHVTPNVYRRHMEGEKYHIGRVFWETNKLPPDFASNVQLMDEIWTGSEFNKQAIMNAGVTKPIHIIPECIDTDIGEIKPFTIPNQLDFKFYSMFEWTERKNPELLLEAFWREFENDEGVSLTLKTYIDNFTPDKRKEVDYMIKVLKRRLGLKKYAPVYTVKKLMNRDQIYRFHKAFDCFVSPHRGEGWGIPQMEAMLIGNPIISTNCGGIHEHLKHKKNAYLLDWKPTKVSNNRNEQWYRGDQMWASVKINDVRKAMRWMYEHKASRDKIAKAGQKIVKDKFNLKTVGEMMKKRLLEIEEAELDVLREEQRKENLT